MTDPDTTGILCQILPFKALHTLDPMKVIYTYQYTLSILPLNIMPAEEHMKDTDTSWYNERSKHLLVLFV